MVSESHEAPFHRPSSPRSSLIASAWASRERAITDSTDALLEDLLHLKRFAFAVYRVACQHRATQEAFLRPDFPLVGGDVIEPYFRDLDERLGRLLDALGAVKESINGSFALYVSQVAHRTNDIMKVLTIVSVTLLPASVILGFFGTNFEYPRIGTTTGVIVMIALIVLTTDRAHHGRIAGPVHSPGWIAGSAKGSPTSTARHRD